MPPVGRPSPEASLQSHGVHPTRSIRLQRLRRGSKQDCLPGHPSEPLLSSVCHHRASGSQLENTADRPPPPSPQATPPTKELNSWAPWGGRAGPAWVELGVPGALMLKRVGGEASGEWGLR